MERSETVLKGSLASLLAQSARFGSTRAERHVAFTPGEDHGWRVSAHPQASASSASPSVNGHERRTQLTRRSWEHFVF